MLTARLLAPITKSCRLQPRPWASYRVCKSWLSSSGGSTVMKNKCGAVIVEPEKNAESKPVALIVGWANSQQKHLQKYSQFLNQQGFTTVTLTSTYVNTFFRPGTKMKEISHCVMDLLLEMDCRQRPVVTYAFSQGGGAMFYHIQKAISQPGTQYHNSLNIVGSIFDCCPVEPKIVAVFRAQQALTDYINNPVLRILIGGIVMVTLPWNVLFDSTTKNYWSGLMNCPLPCPQLYLYSKVDKLVPYQELEGFIQARKDRGIHVISKRWEDPAHVSIMRNYTEEYFETIDTFLKKQLKIV